MLKVDILRCGAAMAAGLFASIAVAQQVDIKGMRIGMPKTELIEKFGPLPIRDFSVAGAVQKHKELWLSFREEKLDEMIFYFDADDFDDVMVAVRSKYPATRCTPSTVSNGFGASFQQIDCKLDRPGSLLRLSRFTNDTTTSSLAIYSREQWNEIINRARVRRKEI